jgi:putative phosphoribosyl transferase
VYQNRIKAGELLLNEIIKRGIDKHASFLFAVPRGGVEVAFPISQGLKKQIILLIVHKIPSSINKELAIGAVSIFGDSYLNELSRAESDAYIQKAIKAALDEVKERFEKYGTKFDFHNIKGKEVLLVDDGIATGATLFLAAKGLAKFEPKKIYTVVPVSSIDGLELLLPISEVISPIVDRYFIAVSQYYAEFSQLSEEQTIKHIQESSKSASTGA